MDLKRVRSKSAFLEKQKSCLLLMIKNSKSLIQTKRENFERDRKNAKNDQNDKFTKIYDKKIKRIKRNSGNLKFEFDFQKILLQKRKREISKKKPLKIRFKSKQSKIKKNKKTLVFKSKRQSKAFDFYKNEKIKIRFNSIKNKLCQTEYDEDFDTDDDIILQGIKKILNIFFKETL
jgi:hypothetical protein